MKMLPRLCVLRLAFYASRPTSHVSRFAPRALALCALLLLTAWTSLPQQTATVTGRVTNGTAAGATPAGLPITLHVFSGEEESGVHSVTLADDGSFRFDDLAVEGDETFVVRVVYQDVIYLSDLRTLEADERELSLPVVVYEATEDPASVSITQLHLFIFVSEGVLTIEEYSLVSNAGDRTYVGVKDPETGLRTTLSFTLPDGAGGVWFDGPGLGERYLYRDGGFGDTAPVLPGTSTIEVDYVYELAYREGIRVERVFDVPVDSATLVLSGDSQVLAGGGVMLAGTLDTQAGPARTYVAGPLAMGEPLAFSVSGAAPADGTQTATPAVRSPGQEIALGLVVLALAAAVAYGLWRSPSPAPLPSRVRPMVEAIATLEVAYEAGEVEEERYDLELKALEEQIEQALTATERDGIRAGGAEA